MYHPETKKKQTISFDFNSILVSNGCFDSTFLFFGVKLPNTITHMIAWVKSQQSFTCPSPFAVVGFQEVSVADFPKLGMSVPHNL